MKRYCRSPWTQQAFAYSVRGLLPQRTLLCCASGSPLQTQAFLLCHMLRTYDWTYRNISYRVSR
ncbi:hypothetical protein FYJ32_03055 [Bifidobacterium tsurumiense]|nr:hypothetical protein [Bifidobacterium tsurumiense]